MTSLNASAAVIESYAARARFARAETAAVARPRMLRGLLRARPHVAEIPCGAGHFLTDYARAGAAVTLVDASPQMLAAAVDHAAAVGIPAEQTFPTAAYLQDLALLDEVDLVVAPNAAMNQLACQSSLPEMLAALRQALRPGVKVLAQLACTHPGGGVDSASFYDAGRQHGVWFPDRWFDPDAAAGAVLRRRRQQRTSDLLSIEFGYISPAGHTLHTTSVELSLFSAPQIRGAFTAAGFLAIRYLPGNGGLSEVLATVGPGSES